jgi:BirA family transcriptional regulator, biotin operon repressor / biotin---[acetyl-CoA-carboxylase] ligase
VRVALLIKEAPIRHFETIDSTNLEAARLAASGEHGPLWIISDEQHAGKGRLGRQWSSPLGNLYSTLLLTIDAPQTIIPQLGFVTGLAVHDTVHQHCPTQSVKLKWPNDCLLNGGKVAGILCESLGQGKVAIGCGININNSPQGLAYATAHIGNITVEGVFTTYRTNLQTRLNQWNNGTGFPTIVSDWQTRASNLNSTITITQGNATKTGIFRGLANDGALQLEKADGTVELLYAGDVSPKLENRP